MRPQRMMALTIIAVAAFGLAVSGWRYHHASQVARAFAEGTPEAYTRLLQDPDVRARALYNLGNAYLREALKDEKVDRLRQAVAYYREALRADPSLVEAKRNYELASRLLDRSERLHLEIDAQQEHVPDEALKPGMTPWDLDI